MFARSHPASTIQRPRNRVKDKSTKWLDVPAPYKTKRKMVRPETIEIECEMISCAVTHERIPCAHLSVSNQMNKYFTIFSSFYCFPIRFPFDASLPNRLTEEKWYKLTPFINRQRANRVIISWRASAFEQRRRHDAVAALNGKQTKIERKIMNYDFDLILFPTLSR